MTHDWPPVSLGEVMSQYQEYIDAPEPKVYAKLSVKLYGKGVTLDESVDGATLHMKRHQIAKTGQVILSEIWGKKGAIGFVPPEGDGALCTSHFFLFDVHTDKINPKWLQAIFTANHLQEQLGAEAKGTTGYAAVRPRNLLAATIPLPPLDEQRRLVTRIEALAVKIEEARGLHRLMVEEAGALAASEANRLFDSMPEYDESPLGRLGVNGTNPIQTGPFGAQVHKSDFVTEGVPILNVGNVRPEGLDRTRLDRVSPEKAGTLLRYTIAQDDLLFARTGATLGKVCLVPEGCDGWLMTGHLFRVRFDQSRCNPRYAHVALRHAEKIRSQIFDQVRGATRPGFNTTLLSRVRLPLPPLEEQRRIVAHLDGLQSKVDAVKQMQAQMRAELDALLPAVLDQAFKGEL